MATTVLTTDELVTNALAALRFRFKNRSTHPESLLFKWATALAGLISSIHAQVQQADYDATPQSKSTYEALALWAFLLGLPNGSGGFGPLGATAAAGLTAQASGTPGSVVWNGVAPAPTLTASDGTLFAMSSAATLDGSGLATIAFDAGTVGTAGNLVAGAVVTFVSSIPGVNATASSVTAPTVPGSDQEAPDALLARIESRLQDPPKAGVAHDWRGWAEGVTTSPRVARAFIYPVRNGTGTVDAVITKAGSGIARAANAGQLAAVLAVFDAERLVCVAGRRAVAPDVTASAAVVLRVLPTVGNEFDWDSSAGAITIDSLPDANHIKLSTLLPASGKAAIDAGRTIRLQLVAHAGAYILPIQVSASAYSDAFGLSTLTISAGYPGTISPSDLVHAGGPCVDAVAQAVLELVDSLGPSKVSGFADPLDSAWDDTLRVDELVRVAMDATVGGARLVRDMVAAPTINGVATNLQAADSGPAPQLLVLASVAVTP